MGMGRRMYLATSAVVFWIVAAYAWSVLVRDDADGCGDLSSSFSFCGSAPSVGELFVFIVLGGFFAVLLRVLMPVVWHPRQMSFLRWSGAGWLHRLHAAFLVCVMCLAMSWMIWSGLGGEYHEVDFDRHRDIL